MNDDRICKVMDTKNPDNQKFMRYTTAQNVQVKRRGLKIMNRPGTKEPWILTPEEVDAMHGLKDGDGNDFTPEYLDPQGNKVDKAGQPTSPVEVKPAEPKETIPAQKTELELAKAEADKLGIKYRSNIGLETLTEKIKEENDGTE